MNKQLIEMVSKCAWDIDDYLFTQVSENMLSLQRAFDALNNKNDVKLYPHEYTNAHIMKSLYENKKSVFIQETEIVYSIEESEFSLKYRKNEQIARIKIEYQGLSFIHDNKAENFKLFTIKENKEFYEKVNMVSFFKVFKIIDKYLVAEKNLSNNLFKLIAPKDTRFYYQLFQEKSIDNFSLIDFAREDFKNYSYLLILMRKEKYEGFFNYLLDEKIINQLNKEEYLSHLLSLNTNTFQDKISKMGFSSNNFIINHEIQKDLNPYIDKIKKHLLCEKLNNNLPIINNKPKKFKV